VPNALNAPGKQSQMRAAWPVFLRLNYVLKGKQRRFPFWTNILEQTTDTVHGTRLYMGTPRTFVNQRASYHLGIQKSWKRRVLISNGRCTGSLSTAPEITKQFTEKRSVNTWNRFTLHTDSTLQSLYAYKSTCEKSTGANKIQMRGKQKTFCFFSHPIFINHKSLWI